MKWNIRELQQRVEALVTNAGFIPDMYYIKTDFDYIVVYFDKKAAVDYFKGDFENSELSKICVFEYKRDGKKHGAYMYFW